MTFLNISKLSLNALTLLTKRSSLPFPQNTTVELMSSLGQRPSFLEPTQVEEVLFCPNNQH